MKVTVRDLDEGCWILGHARNHVAGDAAARRLLGELQRAVEAEMDVMVTVSFLKGD